MLSATLNKGLSVHVDGEEHTLASGDSMYFSMLFRVDPRDPLTIVVVTAVIGGVALVSTVWPMLRATRVDPVSVLRS